MDKLTNLLQQSFDALDMAVLYAKDDDLERFVCASGQCLWLGSLFGLADCQREFDVGLNPFLADFLIDAKNVWLDPDAEPLYSGLWTEQLDEDTKLHLEAIAVNAEQPLLVVCNRAEEYQYRQQTLQSARELLLANDKLVERHEFLHQRLLSLLQRPKGAIEPDALKAVIAHSDEGILILDKRMQPLLENPALYELFEINNQDNLMPNSPLEQVLVMFQQQVPEMSRIYQTGQSWNGELCWLNPPYTLKWLNVSLYPVKNNQQEIENWVVFLSDVSQMRYLLQSNQSMNLHDSMTNLPNRAAFWQVLEREVEGNEPFYLLYLDINDFKRINEFYGHREGDKLLVEMAGRISRAIKKGDVVSRVGGDEFAIILRSVPDQRSCEEVAARIMQVTEKPFETHHGSGYSVSVSVGATGYPQDTRSAEELMRFADLSAYNGRRRQKRSIVFYSHQMREKSRHRIQLERELRQALLSDQLSVVLQPIYELNTQTVIKAEVLLRWSHPERGPISPEQFIPIAENNGFIVPLGKWVFEQACCLLNQLMTNNKTIKLSINLSPVQVADPHFIKFIRRCVADYKVNPQWLELEITEGVLVDDVDTVELFLKNVREMGFTVSVDDFGTGYSSMAYLKRLPIDTLKIDRSFVQDVINNDSDASIVRAVISLAHSLNMKVIAEGVETAEQERFLQAYQCDLAQGFLFCKPVAFNDLLELL